MQFILIKKIKPKKPGIKIFDAGMGDGSLLMNVMRQCHQEKPNIPLLVSTKEISMEDVRLALEKLPDRFVSIKNSFCNFKFTLFRSSIFEIKK